MAVQYLLYKLAAFLAGTIAQEPLAELIAALGPPSVCCWA